MAEGPTPAPRFGVDVQAQLEDWWYNTYLPEFRQRYGDDAKAYVAVLDPAERGGYDWCEPLECEEHTLITGRDHTDPVFVGLTGLAANAVGKLSFVLRTGLNSVEAEQRPDLVEPGDFPYEGAGTYRGYTGGVSGLRKEDDWRVFCEVVDKIIELRAAAAKVPIEGIANRTPHDGPDVKYLEGNWVLDGQGNQFMSPSAD